MDTSDPGIVFDARGWCDHCDNYYNNILPHWHPDERGAEELARVSEKIRQDGKGKDFDCIIGISGGVDSSYLTYIAKERMELRPLVYHVDAGWNSQEAVNNIECIVDGLGLELFTEVVDWEEVRDLQLAVLKASVPYADIVQDLAFFGGMYNFAIKNGVKYILTGSNFSTECVRQPLEWAYYATDLRHVLDLHRRFGTRPLRSFPMASIFRYKIFDRFIRGIKTVKPLDLVPYRKDDAIEELTQKFGWQRYPHKHYESRATRLIESYWMPEKFGYDNRRAHFSSLILTGQMTRDAAIKLISKKAYDQQMIDHDIEYFSTKLGISVDEFYAIMSLPNRNYWDYKNSKWLINLGNRVLSLTGVQRMMIR